MPINYKLYPKNWKTKIRPDILGRANNCCENCGVDNYKVVFRGYLRDGKEVYQDADGRVFDAENSTFLFKDVYAWIEPLSGNPNQLAIKIILTISHTDHDISNNNYSNLKALCQRCHNRHDAAYRKENRRKNKGELKLF